jgi:hypothetical protein
VIGVGMRRGKTKWRTSCENSFWQRCRRFR